MKNMIELYLSELFNNLNNSSIKYIVLRGYEKLPKEIGNDIDFGVNDKHTESFLSILDLTSHKHGFKLVRDVVRLDLIKTMVVKDDFFIKIDIQHRFSYFGQEYYSVINMINKRSYYKDLFFVPTRNDELALSILKEILHNSRVRPDKVQYLKSLFEDYGLGSGIKDYFSNRSVMHLNEIMQKPEVEYFKKISLCIRIDLLIQNLKLYGLLNVLRNIFLFCWIKYFKQSYYDIYFNNQNHTNNLTKNELSGL